MHECQASDPLAIVNSIFKMFLVPRLPRLNAIGIKTDIDIPIELAAAQVRTEATRQVLIVGIEKGQIVSRADFNAAISRSGRTFILLSDIHNVVTERTQCLLRTIRATVVDNNDFHIYPLFEHRPYGTLDRIFFVEKRNDSRNTQTVALD